MQSIYVLKTHHTDFLRLLYAMLQGEKQTGCIPVTLADDDK